jgi:hypothetical protein
LQGDIGSGPALANEKGPLTGLGAQQLVHVGIVEIDLEQALHIRDCLPLLEAHICRAHDEGGCGNECEHVGVFSLFISAFKEWTTV